MSEPLTVRELESSDGSINIQTTSLKSRLVQRFTRTFKGGTWNPANTYYEIPGSFINITPLYDNSIIIYTYTGAVAWINAWTSNHAISHWRFYVNGKEHARHNKSARYIEENSVVKWEVPSWGAGRSGSMGYYARQYNNGNNGVYFNGRNYKDGGRSIEPVSVFISIEEIVIS